MTNQRDFTDDRFQMKVPLFTNEYTDTQGYPNLIVMPQDRHYPRQLIKHRTTTLWWVEKKSVGKILKNGLKQPLFEKFEQLMANNLFFLYKKLVNALKGAK